MERREKRVIELERSRPFVSIETKPETRRDHAQMVVLMAATALSIIGLSVPDAAAVVPAFIAGYAVSNWAVYPEREEVR